MQKVTRRGLVKGLIAGAIVLGFDPRARSWVTEASAGTFSSVPPLDGVLSTDPNVLATYADDYGHIIHRTPVAVLLPGSVGDIVKIILFCGQQGIRISGRGKGHTVIGQSQAEAGVVIDLTTLDVIHSIGCDRAVVDAGVVWRDLLLATTAQGLTPPVLTDFTGITVGGTLSVGGCGGTSYRYGAQVDNILELQVVTGQGEIVTCSPWKRPDVFNAALAGLGLCAIIVRVTVALVPAHTTARVFDFYYADVPTMLEDLRKLATTQKDGCGPRLDNLRANASPGPTGWSYYIEAVSNFTAPEDPSADKLLAGLNYLPGSLQTQDVTFFEYTDTVYQLIQELNAAGLGGYPHPWLDLFVPGSAIDSFAVSTLASLDPTSMIPGSIVLFYPFQADKLHQPLFSVPDEEFFFLFDVLLTLPPVPAIVNEVLQVNRALYDENVAQGGKSYVISAVELSPQDWKKHFQPAWGFLTQVKNRYDPGNVLGLGPGVFP
jgi:FAD/FMN-containing dehydrogenase